MPAAQEAGTHSWQSAVGSRQFNLKTANRKLQTKIKSGSSVWLEHYTDNVGVSSSNLLGSTPERAEPVQRQQPYGRAACGPDAERASCYQRVEELKSPSGGLAQLARAPALQAGGHRFDSDILHSVKSSLKLFSFDVTMRSASVCRFATWASANP